LYDCAAAARAADAPAGAAPLCPSPPLTAGGGSVTSWKTVTTLGWDEVLILETASPDLALAEVSVSKPKLAARATAPDATVMVTAANSAATLRLSIGEVSLGLDPEIVDHPGFPLSRTGGSCQLFSAPAEVSFSRVKRMGVAKSLNESGNGRANRWQNLS
jgi:hypothetical protein